MDIGSPPLYAEINRAARDMDKSYLSELGPLHRALVVVIALAEKYKSEGDKMTPGKDLGGDSWNMGGSFVLWRGAPM